MSEKVERSDNGDGASPHFVGLGERLTHFMVSWLHVGYDDLVVAKHLMEKGIAYRQVSIDKGRKKEKRVLHVPTEELKTLQRCILDHVLSFIPVHFAAYGCRNGVSFVAGAKWLSGFTKSLYCLDLRHAFPSVTRQRAYTHLRGALRYQLRQFGFPLSDEEKEQLIQAIVDLVVYHDSIPQGAPTSPALLNIVCMKMDQEITAFLARREADGGGSYRYSRYVDDLSIGCDVEDGMPEKDRREIKKIIKDCGFHPHPDKEEYIPIIAPGKKPARVTGVQIHPDGRLTLPRQTLENYRTRLHAMLQKVKRGEVTPELRGEIQGIIGYINQVYEDKIPPVVGPLVGELRKALASKSAKRAKRAVQQ